MASVKVCKSMISLEKSFYIWTFADEEQKQFQN